MLQPRAGIRHVLERCAQGHDRLHFAHHNASTPTLTHRAKSLVARLTVAPLWGERQEESVLNRLGSVMEARVLRRERLAREDCAHLRLELGLRA